MKKMAREILFRGKRKDNGEWITVRTVLHLSDGTVYMPSIRNDVPIATMTEEGNIVELRNIFWCEIVPETLCQYVGTTDIKDNRIFEGDIVKVKDNLTEMTFIGEVGYSNSSFAISDGFITHYRWIDYEVEVIGNVIDNPELLEAENE